MESLLGPLNVVSSFPNRNYRERKDFDGTCMYFVILTGAKYIAVADSR